MVNVEELISWHPRFRAFLHFYLWRFVLCVLLKTKYSVLHALLEAAYFVLYMLLETVFSSLCESLEVVCYVCTWFLQAVCFTLYLVLGRYVTCCICCWKSKFCVVHIIRNCMFCAVGGWMFGVVCGFGIWILFSCYNKNNLNDWIKLRLATCISLSLSF